MSNEVIVNSTETIDSNNINITTNGNSTVTSSTSSVNIEISPNNFVISSSGMYASNSGPTTVPDWLQIAIVNAIGDGITADEVKTITDSIWEEVSKLQDGVAQNVSTLEAQGVSLAELDTYVKSTVDENIAAILNTQQTLATEDFATAVATNTVTAIFDGTNTDANSWVQDTTSSYADSISAVATDVAAMSATIYDETSGMLALSTNLNYTNTYVGLNNGVPDGTGLLADIELLKMQKDARIETYYGTYDIVDTDGNIIETAEPYASWLAAEDTDEDGNVISFVQRYFHFGDIYIKYHMTEDDRYKVIDKAYTYDIVMTGEPPFLVPVLQWVDITDTANIDAYKVALDSLALGDSKITTFYFYSTDSNGEAGGTSAIGSYQPTDGEYGDMWVDPADNNKLYFMTEDGVWKDVSDTRIISMASDINELTVSIYGDDTTEGIEAKLTETAELAAGYFTEWDGTSEDLSLGKMKTVDGIDYLYLGGTLGEDGDGWVKADYYPDINNITTGVTPIVLDNATLSGEAIDEYIANNTVSMVVYSGNDHTEITTANIGDMYIEFTTTDVNSIPVPITYTYDYTDSGWILNANADDMTALVDAVDGKKRITRADNSPTDPDIDDMWIDATTGELYIYSGSSWVIGVSYTDDTLAETAIDNAGTAQATAEAAQSTAEIADNKADDATVLANGAIDSIKRLAKIFKEDYEPSATGINDVWIETDNWYTFDTDGNELGTSNEQPVLGVTDGVDSVEKIRNVTYVYDGDIWVQLLYSELDYTANIMWAGSSSSLLVSPDGLITGFSYGAGSYVDSEFKINADTFIVANSANVEYLKYNSVYGSLQLKGILDIDDIDIAGDGIVSDSSSSSYYASRIVAGNNGIKVAALQIKNNSGSSSVPIYGAEIIGQGGAIIQGFYNYGVRVAAPWYGVYANAEYPLAGYEDEAEMSVAAGYFLNAGTNTIYAKSTSPTSDSRNCILGKSNFTGVRGEGKYGVTGLSDGDTNDAGGYGAWFAGSNGADAGLRADGLDCYGLYVYSDNTSAIEANTENSNGEWGVHTDDKIYAGGGYSPFTGSHIGVTVDTEITIGDIVKVVSPLNINVNQVYTYLDRTSTDSDKNVYGVVNADLDPELETYIFTNNDLSIQDYIEVSIDVEEIDDNGEIVITTKTTTEKDGDRYIKPEYVDIVNSLLDNNYQKVTVNALGEGMANVCSSNGDISRGDYIVSSGVVPGKGMKQDDDIMRSSTVAKSLQEVIWDDEVVGENGCYSITGTDGVDYKVLMIGCTYHCG